MQIENFLGGNDEARVKLCARFCEKLLSQIVYTYTDAELLQRMGSQWRALAFNLGFNWMVIERATIKDHAAKTGSRIRHAYFRLVFVVLASLPRDM